MQAEDAAGEGNEEMQEHVAGQAPAHDVVQPRDEELSLSPGHSPPPQAGPQGDRAASTTAAYRRSPSDAAAAMPS